MQTGMDIKKVFLGALGALFVLWALAAVPNVLGQRKLFINEAKDELYDFWMPRMCLEQGYIGHPERYAGLWNLGNDERIEVDERDVVCSGWYTDGKTTRFVTGWRDKVYPRFAILPFALFPATRAGSLLWTALAGLVLLTALCAIARSPWPVLLAMGMPFLFNLERGNPIWLSAAGVGVFLAWWDSPSERRRLVAAACLAVAGAMKIAPLALGVLYFTKWRWRPVLLCAVLTAVFVFVPWLFDADGMAAFSAMMRNAADHAEYVLRFSDFGLVELWRTARLLTGQCVDEVWPGMMAVARVSQALGVVLLVVGARRRDLLLLVAGMIFAAGNMYYYAALYLYPVLVLEFPRLPADGTQTREGRFAVAEAALWLALLCPVQWIAFGHSANQVIGNTALLGLAALRLAAPRNRQAASMP